MKVPELLEALRRRWGMRPLLVPVALVVLLAWPRVLAEYYYLRIVTARGSETTVHYFNRLEYMRRTAAVAPLMRLLRDEDWLTRATAARRLEKYPHEGVVTALMGAAGDPNEDVRIAALSSLGVIADPRSIPLLKELARDRRVSPYALGALEKLGKAGHEAILEHYRSLSDSSERASSMRCYPEFKEEVQKAIHDPALEVRVRAVPCLPQLIGKEAALPVLRDLLTDPTPEVRGRAILTMAKLRDKSGFEVAMALLEDASQPGEARADAARALDEIGDPQAIPALRRVMEAEARGAARYAAVTALESLNRRFPAQQ